MLSFNDEQVFDNILMGKKPKSGGLLFEVPNYHALVVRAGSKCFIIDWGCHFSYPPFVTNKSLLTKASADFPKSDGFISRTGKQVVSAEYELNAGYIMLVAVESFAAYEVVAKIPELDGQVRRTRGDILPILVVADTVDRV